MKKEVKTGLIVLSALVVVVGLFVTAAWLNHYNYQKTLIYEKDPNLTQDERKIYEDRLAQADAELAKGDISIEQRYDWLMYKGFQLYGLGKYKEATNFIAQAVDLNPDNHTSYVAMYTVQLDMQDNRGAEKSIKRALELKPENADFWKKYIVLMQERFKLTTEEVSNLYKEALEKTSSNIDIITSYASFWESVGNNRFAVEYWQKAKTANPGNSTVYEAEITRLDQKIQAQ